MTVAVCNQAFLIRLAADVARGLAFLHSFSLCHGDLKLDNVLISLSPSSPDKAPSSAGTGGTPLPPSLSLPRAASFRPPSNNYYGGRRLSLDCGTQDTLYKNIVAKLSDFGLTRAMTASHLSTGTVGTITHVSPERLIHGRLGPESDIYALGMIIWEVAEGGAVPHRVRWGGCTLLRKIQKKIFSVHEELDEMPKRGLRPYAQVEAGGGGGRDVSVESI